ncbi:P-loop containing nucleoside triphosphate hydrolase protein [Nemania sp. FL0031]|nr:P-loop containing nucleoside triphosphate hydrolase protein [Nemania sp. FL0031]
MLKMPETIDSNDATGQGAKQDPSANNVGTPSSLKILSAEFRTVDPKKRRSFFRKGVIFRILWPQPSPCPPNPNENIFPVLGWQDTIYMKITWFLVVRPFKSHCIVVPIHTYDGQATTRPGLNADDHTALVLKGCRPRLVEGESLTREPLEMILENKSLDFEETSRVNFSKLYTVEYNVKVMKVGRIVPEHLPIINEYALQSWSREIPPFITPSFTVPFRRDEEFIEDKALFDHINQLFSHPAPRVALLGIGGVGKSQLAIEHAYRVKDAFVQANKELWVFWVYAGTQACVENGFKTIADFVKIPGRNQPAANIFELVSRWLQTEKNGQWLLVIDGADDLNMFYGTGENDSQIATANENRPLWTYLPQSVNGSIIITTRSKELALRLTGSPKNVIEVLPMEPQRALKLLETRLGTLKPGSQQRHIATELVEALEYIPLAITQAVAYIQKRAPRFTLKKYLDEFRESEQLQLNLLQYDSGDLRRSSYASNSIIAIWQNLFDYIWSNRQSAMNLLSLMSFFDSRNIFEYLLRPVGRSNPHSQSPKSNPGNESTEPGEPLMATFEGDIITLLDYGLIRTNETGDIFQSYQLVQLATRAWLEVHQTINVFKTQYIDQIAYAFPAGDFWNWNSCHKLFLHATKAINYPPDDRETLLKWALLLYSAGWYSREQSRYDIAEAMTGKSLETRERILGTNDISTIASAASLALTYSNQGRVREAVEVQRAQTKSAETLRLQDPLTVAMMASLASTFKSQWQLEEARQAEDKVKRWSEEQLDPRYSATPITNCALALMCSNQGRLEAAERLQFQVKEQSEELLRSNHPSMLIGIADLVLTLTYSNRERLEEGVGDVDYKEDEVLQFQVREWCELVLGSDHPLTLASKARLALTYKNQRDLEAKKLQE